VDDPATGRLRAGVKRRPHVALAVPWVLAVIGTANGRQTRPHMADLRMLYACIGMRTMA